MKTKLLLTLIAGLLYFSASAQDPVFSQFYANKVYLNPAFAGSQQGLTLSTSYRNQWSYVPGGFTTYSIAADIQEPYLSSTFGFLAYKDTEGEGFLSTTSAGFVYGYIARLSKTFNIHMAVKTSYVQKAIDWSKLTFTDQLHPVLGVIRPTNAVPILETKSYVDFDAGAVARFELPMKIRGFEGYGNFGVAVHHLTQPDESIQEIETLLPRRFTIHGGLMLPVISFDYAEKRVIYFSPNAKFDYQGDIRVLSYGMYVISNPLYMGVFYAEKNGFLSFQNTNALIFTAGFEGRLNDDTRYTFGYSYDLNTTGLGTRSQGTHEIALMINFETASIWGLPRKSNKKKKWKYGKRVGGRKSVECYKFKGKNSISIY